MSFQRTIDVTEDDAEEIKHAYLYDERTYGWLADQYAVSKTSIRFICNGWYKIDNGKVVLTGKEQE